MNKLNIFKRKIKKTDDKKVKKAKGCQWQEDWLRDNDLKDWIQKHPTKIQKVICKMCCMNLTFSRKYDLIKHSKSNDHKDNVTTALKSGTFKSVEVEGPSFKNRVQTAEMITSYFVAEHNVGVKIVDDLVPCIQRLALDPDSVQHMKLKKDKATGIIKNVLYESSFQELVDILNSTYFSVMIDESTDVSTKKLLCVSVQYFSEKMGKVVQHLLQIIELDGRAGKAKDIYQSFEDFCTKYKINIQNIVALGCDNASVMTGKANGFRKYLEEKVPHLITLNCICHSCALVAKNSCNKIPKEVENLIKKTYNYFAHSTKRFDELRENLRSVLFTGT